MSPSNLLDAAFVGPALEVRENGNHYGGFKVGVMGYDKHGRIFQGANVKPTRDAVPYCAEAQMFDAVEAAGAVLEAIIVVGVPRKEDTAPTLHCCGERCRPRMRGYIREGKVVKPNTRIICVNAVTSYVEEFTVESLHQAHGETLDDV